MKIIIKDIINESVVDRFKDKIINYIVNDTEYSLRPSDYHGYLVGITFPFYGDNKYEFTLSDLNIQLNIYDPSSTVGVVVSWEESDYMKNMFGVEDVELIKEILVKSHLIIFNEVKKLLLNKLDSTNNINESRESKMEKFIDSIIEQLLGDTEYKITTYDNQSPRVVIKFPDSPNVPLEELIYEFDIYDVSDWINYFDLYMLSNLPSIKYISDVYGLSSDETETVYKRYLSQLGNEIYPKMKRLDVSY